MTALCRQVGISRKTGDNWIERFLGGCELGDRWRRSVAAPQAQPPRGRDRRGRCHRRGAPRTPDVGPREAPHEAPDGQPGRGAPVRHDVRADRPAQWTRDPAPAPTTRAAWHRAARPCRGAQRRRVHRRQRRLRRRSWSMLPAHRHRRVQSVPARVCGVGTTPTKSAATTARPTPPCMDRGAAPSAPRGGTSSGFDTRASNPAHRNRTADTSANHNCSPCPRTHRTAPLQRQLILPCAPPAAIATAALFAVNAAGRHPGRARHLPSSRLPILD